MLEESLTALAELTPVKNNRPSPRCCTPHTPVITTTTSIRDYVVMVDKPQSSALLTQELPRRTRPQSTSTSAPNANNRATKTKREAEDASDAESDSSELSTSSEEPSSESEDDSLGQDEDSDAEVTTLPQPPNAEARKNLYKNSVPRSSSLGDRLKEFLPQLAAANAELERDRAAGRLAEKSLEQVDENGQYIEMNLGLGVLEEKDPNKMDQDSESSDDSEDEMETDATGAENKEQDVLGKLMGTKTSKSGAGIQEVPET
ncbi:hypothetical protein JOL62DRAFT_611037 [Phyllosticta paracitricarpa]|uniref:Uncharacterized protein n=2 Tax=Phyllosticta TaxID=121621 RepID=A0ABR1NBD2_9PEZI